MTTVRSTSASRPDEALGYVAAMLAELSEMARSVASPILGDLLDDATRQAKFEARVANAIRTKANQSRYSGGRIRTTRSPTRKPRG